MRMNGKVLLRASPRADALPGVGEAHFGWRHPERRSSLRVELGEGLPVQLVGVGPCRLKDVSLGGGMLHVRQKLGSGDRYLLHVDYQDSQTSLPVRVYHNALYELFYDPGADSRVSFRARVVCCDASIESLNLLYRIMRDHWSPDASVDDIGRASSRRDLCRRFPAQGHAASRLR